MTNSYDILQSEERMMPTSIRSISHSLLLLLLRKISANHRRGIPSFPCDLMLIAILSFTDNFQTLFMPAVCYSWMEK
ncbi:hypothetical protein L6164_015295 [Bauhinia variegata]|uniref:Uncharacterized protein n=1 Tax=Bauhinia variegata TaxID=167791 RepID=A0ACB9NQ01_BAUVA|nr:hypothetical protein L6164_015295 [Bauhinia variegata]